MVGSTTAQPSPQSPSLATLPSEILCTIAGLLDVPDSLNFALVSRRLTLPADNGLWRTLTIKPPWVGELGDAPDSVWDYSDWDFKAREEEESDSTRFQAKLKGMLSRLDRRRSGLVEEIRFQPRPGGVDGLNQILHLVSPNLRAMRILQFPKEQSFAFVNDDGPDYDRFDYKYIDAGLHFPALTYVRVESDTIKFSSFIPLLCNSAPNLITLEASLTTLARSVPEDHQDRLPIMQETKIQELYLSISTSQKEEGEEPKDELTKFVLHCPALRRVAMGGHFGREMLSFMDGVKDLHDLRVWSMGLEDFDYWVGGSMCCGLQSLRRLVLDDFDDFEAVARMPVLPMLEIVFITYPPSRCRHLPHRELPLSPLPATYPVSPMIEHLSACLRLSPRLRHVHFLCEDVWDYDADYWGRLDRLEEGTEMGTIRSFQHEPKGHELLHLRIPLQHREILDEVRTGEFEEYEGMHALHYESDRARQEWRVKLFEPLLRPVFQDFTDYRGVMVPLEVIEGMRIAEGASEEAWRRRGIIVGDAGWAVLTEWHDAHLAARAPEVDAEKKATVEPGSEDESA